MALNSRTSAGTRLTVVNTETTATDAADLGGADVAAGAGLPLAGGATLTVELAPGDVHYAIQSGANAADLAVLRT